MDPLRLAFAPHVGFYISAALSEPNLLAVCLAAGTRGEHRVVVLDGDASYQPIAPSRSRGALVPALRPLSSRMSSSSAVMTTRSPGTRCEQGPWPGNERSRHRQGWHSTTSAMAGSS